MTSPLQLTSPLPEAYPHVRIAQSVDQSRKGLFLVADRITRAALQLMELVAHV